MTFFLLFLRTCLAGFLGGFFLMLIPHVIIFPFLGYISADTAFVPFAILLILNGFFPTILYGRRFAAKKFSDKFDRFSLVCWIILVVVVASCLIGFTVAHAVVHAIGFQKNTFLCNTCIPGCLL